MSTFESLPRITMDPSVHIGSTWKRLYIGKRLTDRRIRELELLGYYGKERQLRADRRVTLTRNGVPMACSCGQVLAVKFLRWAYLPKSGWYCPACVAVHRAARDREREQHRRWLEAMAERYQ